MNEELGCTVCARYHVTCKFFIILHSSFFIFNSSFLILHLIHWADFTQYPFPYRVCTLRPTCASRRLNAVHVQSRNAAGFFRLNVA